MNRNWQQFQATLDAISQAIAAKDCAPEILDRSQTAQYQAEHGATPLINPIPIAAQTSVMHVKKGRYRPAPCPCTCVGCTDPNTGARHCLKPPCTRQRNRRSNAEIDAAERYPNGRIRIPGVTPRDKPASPPRSPEQIAKVGRYPNGRPKPDRTKWSEPPAKNPRSKQPETVGKHDDPLAAKPTWFVIATRRNTSVRLAAPNGKDEAWRMAARLIGHGWDCVVEGYDE